MKPFFGYPGGKSRATNLIKEMIGWSESDHRRIAEPFAGGGSFSLSCGLPAWINDLDADLYCLWVSVRDYPDDLCDLVDNRKITPDQFYTLKEKLRKTRPAPKTKKAILKRGIDKLVIHKISFSNMGEMSGSPVGGKNQTGKWKFDVRWNIESIKRSLMKASSLIQGWDITHLNYKQVLSRLRADDFIFVDPPYVEAGGKCYKHSFTYADHLALSNTLKTRSNWVLTYDNSEIIHDIYSWAKISPLSFKYFMSSARSAGEEMKYGRELLIRPE